VIDGDHVAELLDHVDEADLDLTHAQLSGRVANRSDESARSRASPEESRPDEDLLRSSSGWPRIGAAERGCQERDIRGKWRFGVRIAQVCPLRFGEFVLAADQAVPAAGRRGSRALPGQMHIPGTLGTSRAGPSSLWRLFDA
jgi:hypothetical protein